MPERSQKKMMAFSLGGGMMPGNQKNKCCMDTQPYFTDTS